MFRAHTRAGHKSHLPLGSAKALEAQNNADSDTNELVLFSAGKRAEEKGGPGRLWGPQPSSEDACRTRWRVGCTQFLEHLHSWRPCTCHGTCRGMPGRCYSMHGSLTTHGHLGAAGEADTGLSSSVSLLNLASEALWL